MKIHLNPVLTTDLISGILHIQKTHWLWDEGNQKSKKYAKLFRGCRTNSCCTLFYAGSLSHHHGLLGHLKKNGALVNVIGNTCAFPDRSEFVLWKRPIVHAALVWLAGMLKGAVHPKIQNILDSYLFVSYAIYPSRSIWRELLRQVCVLPNIMELYGLWFMVCVALSALYRNHDLLTQRTISPHGREHATTYGRG